MDDKDKKLIEDLDKVLIEGDPPKPYLTQLVQTRIEMALEEEEGD